MTFRGQKPFVTNDTFVAPTASLIGNVTNWDQSSVWYKAVVRADNETSGKADAGITIGFSSSVGEGSVVTTAKVDVLPETGFPPSTYIGHYVSIGAGCVLKSCHINDLVDIGDKCTLLEGSYVEHHVVLEPGTVVLPYQRIPTGTKYGGNPATYIADLTNEEKEAIQAKSVKIHELAKEHLVEFLPYGFSYVQLEELERENAAKEE